MKMRLFVILLSIVYGGLMSSCTTYYYSTIDSNDRKVIKQDNGDFTQENDTVAITYCFYGENLPIEITVYNKLDQPLFLDWQQSALIVEETAESYVSRDMAIRGGFSSDTYSYQDYLFPDVSYGKATGTFSARGRIPENVAFIPPKSMMNSTPITLSNFEFGRISKEEYTKQQFMKADNKMTTLKAIDFTEENTPLRFRSYLTLYTVNEDGSRSSSMAFEQHFYISQLIKGGSLSPSNFQANNAQRGDFFYVRKENGSTIAVITGAVAIGVAGVAIDAAISPRRY